MKTNSTYAKIDDYLLGTLSKAELLDFKKMIKHDEDLANNVQLQQEIFEAIRDERKREIRKTLNQIHREETGRRFSIHLPSWRVQAAAAAIVIFLVSGGLLGHFMSSSNSPDALYSTYFNPENSLLSVRSGESLNSSLREGMYYYEQGRYEDAIKVFEAEPGNLIGTLYTGFSLMSLEKYEQAEAKFVEIINDKDNLLIDQAEWNLGLCYLKSGELLKADDVFRKISADNTIYSKDAKTILQQMKEE